MRNDTDNLRGTRQDAVGLGAPGLDEAAYRLERTLEAQLQHVVTATLESSRSVELLLSTRPAHTGVAVHASRTAMHSDQPRAEATDQESTLSKSLAERCVEALPEWCGVVRGRLSLAPLGRAAMPTARLVTSDAQSTPKIRSLLRSILAYNGERTIPTVCQLLVEPRTDGQYEITIRVVADHATPPPLTSRELAATLARPPRDALAAVTPDGLSSSRQLLREYWTCETHLDLDDRLRPQASRTSCSVSPAATSALELAKSTAEYAAFLDGRVATQLYDDLDVSPTLTVTDDQLQSLLDVFPVYSVYAWPSSSRRHPPRFDPVDTYSETAATAHDDRWIGDDDTSMAQSSRSVSERSLETALVDWLTDRGTQPTAVENRGYGDPHFRGHHRSQDGPVVIVDPDAGGSETAITAAGELVMAANQAARDDQQLLVVTPSTSAARWARDVLAVPYATRTDDGFVQPYTAPASVDTPRGALVCRRDGSSSPTWSVAPDGTRRLLFGDHCVATGAVATPPAVETYATPAAVPTDDEVVVRDRHGAVQARYPSAAALTDDYWIVYRPVLPVRPTFIAAVTVVTRDGPRFVVPSREPRWADRCNSTWYKAELDAALAQFIETYTTKRTARGERARDFGRVFRRWFHEQIDWPLSSVRPLERRLPDRVSANTDKSNRITSLRRRDWRIPIEFLQAGHGGPSPLNADRR